MEYHCDSCGMAVKGLICAKCNAELVLDKIIVDGKEVEVSKCPLMAVEK